MCTSEHVHTLCAHLCALCIVWTKCTCLLMMKMRFFTSQKLAGGGLCFYITIFTGLENPKKSLFWENLLYSTPKISPF